MMADTRKISLKGPIQFAIPCAGSCGAFALVTMPVKVVEQLISELALFGWFLSEGQVPDMKEKIYSPLCPSCAERLSAEATAGEAPVKEPPKAS